MQICILKVFVFLPNLGLVSQPHRLYQSLRVSEFNWQCRGILKQHVFTQDNQKLSDKELHGAASQDYIAQAALCITPIGHSCCLHWERTSAAPCHLFVEFAQVCLSDQYPHLNTTLSLVFQSPLSIVIIFVRAFSHRFFVCLS